MKTITVEISVSDHGMGGGFDVVDWYGRRAGFLSFEEMLGQVISLAHPNVGAPRFLMLTEEEWAARDAERIARIAAQREPAARIVDDNADDIPF